MTVADWTDRLLELEVGAVAHGGHCVARAGEDGEPDPHGRVVFVRHALPGERVRAVVTEDGGGAFCRADVVDVLRGSPDRVAAPCEWARPGGCGGCDVQHVAPSAQRAWKTDVLREQLTRLAGLDPSGLLSEVVVEELPGGPLGWRTRIRLAVDDDGAAGLRAHRSHDVCPVADCLLAPPGSLAPVLAAPHPPGSEVDVTVDEIGVARTDAVTVAHAAGRRWPLTPGVFWQVHPALADTLADLVRDWADAPAGGTAWDLYGGVGVLASVLAEQVGPDGGVDVVESSAAAVSDGRRALADVPWVRWHIGRVEREVARLPADPDVVVTDPPRAGLGKAVVRALAGRGPARVVHVACDPASLARDVALFAEHGYRLDALRAFDAFPMTHHLEAVALLVRDDGTVQDRGAVNP